jgi:hypothetical protein
VQPRLEPRLARRPLFVPRVNDRPLVVAREHDREPRPPPRLAPERLGPLAHLGPHARRRRLAVEHPALGGARAGRRGRGGRPPGQAPGAPEAVLDQRERGLFFALEREAMPRPRQLDQPRAGHQARQAARVAGRHDAVAVAGEHQRRRLQPLQPRLGVVAHDREHLQPLGAAAAVVRVAEPREVAVGLAAQIVVGHEQRADPQGVGAVCGVVPREVARHQLEGRTQVGLRAAQVARERAAERERPDAPRVPQGELLRDHAPHRHAEHVGRGGPGRVEHRRRVVGEVGHARADRERRRAPGALVVEGDDAEVRLEPGGQGEPRARRERHAHHQQDRRGGLVAANLVMNAVRAAVDEGHGAQAPRRLCRAGRGQGRRAIGARIPAPGAPSAAKSTGPQGRGRAAPRAGEVAPPGRRPHNSAP